jgi:hypothetical protein
MEALGIAVQEELAKAEADLDALIRQRDGVQARIEQLEVEVAGLRRLSQKYSPNGAKGSARPDEWVYLTRAEAVERILQMANGPMSAKEIIGELKSHGRVGDSQNGVSGVLSRLKSGRKAHPFGKRGYWVWAENAPETTPETEERPDN